MQPPLASRSLFSDDHLTQLAKSGFTTRTRVQCVLVLFFLWMGPDELLDKNLKAFGPAIGEKRLAELDWDYINTKLSSSSFEDDFKNWHASPDKAIIMPDIMPRSRELMEYYLKLV